MRPRHLIPVLPALAALLALAGGPSARAAGIKVDRINVRIILDPSVLFTFTLVLEAPEDQALEIRGGMNTGDFFTLYDAERLITGTEIAFGMDGRVLASTLRGDGRAALEEILERDLVSGNVVLRGVEYAARTLPLSIDRSAREVLTEIGNILLNACLGTFGNLLKVQVSFSVPHLTLETLEHIVDTISIEREGLRYALIVHAAFRLRNSSLTGYLVIVLGVASIERLIRALDAWERQQG